jgi:hypothetical protein
MQRSLFAVLLALLLILPVHVAFAQVPTPLSTLDDLKFRYRASLDLYRSKEDQFSIAAQQYYVLGTLAAQEEAVRSAREVGLARVDTLLIYIEAIRLTLESNTGIELNRKDTLQRQFSLLVDNLKKHRSRLEIVTNRLQIEDENFYLEGQQKLIEALCYEALSLIKIGAAQKALDQLVITKDELDKYISVAKISETARTERQRGSDEIGRSIENIRSTINLTLTEYDEGLEGADNSLFRKVQEQLGPAYRGLTQALAFVKELSK